jgi:hypothetical protein
MLHDIALYLQSQGVGTAGVDIFESYLPPKPDKVLALYETGGSESELAAAIDRPTFQVMARAKTWDEARAFAFQAYDKLNGLSEQVLNGTRYLLIVSTSGFLSAGLDESGRPLCTVNFRCIVEVPTMHR